MTRGWERCFFVLCFIFQGPSYLSAYAYGGMHRLHHAYTDTEKDPHTPLRSRNPFRMLWDTSVSYGDVFFERENIEAQYLARLPRWPAFDRVAHTIYARLLWMAFYAWLWSQLATAWWQWLLLPVSVFSSAVHGMIINYFGHTVGYRNFDLTNRSHNIFPFFDIFLMGESYHNNHHRYPARSNFAVRWFEWDPTYTLMRLLSFLRVIRMRDESPQET